MRLQVLPGHICYCKQAKRKLLMNETMARTHLYCRSDHFLEAGDTITPTDAIKLSDELFVHL